MGYEVNATAGSQIEVTAESLPEGGTADVFFLTPDEYAEHQELQQKRSDPTEQDTGQWLLTERYRRVAGKDPRCVFEVPSTGKWYVVFDGPSAFEPRIHVRRLSDTPD